MPHNIKDLCKAVVDQNASDLHITAGSVVHIRVDEVLVAVSQEVLSLQGGRALLFSILTKEQIEKFERELELDAAFDIEGCGRFRINVFKQRNCVAASIRIVPGSLWSFEKCGLPVNVAIDLCNRPKGLVLV